MNNGCIPQEITQHHLHIKKLTGYDPARHRNKGDPRKGGANHAKSHNVPPRIPVANKKAGAVDLSRGEETYEQQYEKVCRKQTKYKQGIHSISELNKV